MAGEISPQVRRFIQTTIGSVEELEVLLFMMSNAERGWTAAEVSERTRLVEESVSDRLAELHRAKLLTLEGASTYRYAPTSKALAQEVAESLDRAYRERRESVIQLIYTRPFDNIRVLADAFRIKEKDE